MLKKENSNTRILKTVGALTPLCNIHTPIKVEYRGMIEKIDGIRKDIEEG